MEIKVIVKNVYGNTNVYPACPTAKILCQLTGRKTLTHTDLQNIKALGYNVVNVTAQPTF